MEPFLGLSAPHFRPRSLRFQTESQPRRTVGKSNFTGKAESLATDSVQHQTIVSMRVYTDIASVHTSHIAHGQFKNAAGTAVGRNAVYRDIRHFGSILKCRISRLGSGHQTKCADNPATGLNHMAPPLGNVSACRCRRRIAVRPLRKVTIGPHIPARCCINLGKPRDIAGSPRSD